MNPTDLDSMRLLVFVEQRFWKSDTRYSTDEPFVLFLDGLLPTIQKLIYIARLESSVDTEKYLLNPSCVVWPVPPYSNLIELSFLSLFILPKIAWQLFRNRRDWDAACICGPHLIGITVAVVCELLNRPYFFIVRENLPKMVQYRYPAKFRLLAVVQSRVLEIIYMVLSCFHPVLIVGDEVLKKYRRFGSQVKPLFVSLVEKDQLWNRDVSQHFSDEKPFQLLTVVRLAPEKDLGLLIDVLTELIEAGKNVHLKIVGDGPEREFLEARVSALSIQSYVSFCGYVPYGSQLLQLYRDADAFVLTSFSEGFPQVIIEAMACSLPIVATHVGGIPQVVKHEDNGLLVSPGSKVELFSMLLRLIENPDLCRNLSKSAYKTAEGLTKEAQVAVLINTLREIA